MISNADVNSITVTGTVTEIIYTNEENGYCVCEIDSKDEGAFTATGYMPYISEGENIELTGRWVTHPEYGEQFSVSGYRTLLPTEKNAILMYLSSGVIKGIRSATAKKIVDSFGEDSFDILLNSPEKLSEIKGITKKAALGFSEQFHNLQSVSSIVMFLQQFNISARLATNVHKVLGNNAVEIIRRNPYVLADRVDGISFKTADNIAHILGIAKNSPERISAFIKYTLTNAAYISGHTFLPKELLCEHIVSNLEITDDEAENAIVALSTEKDLYCDTVGGVTACYLSHFLTAESYVARRIYTLSQADQKYTLPTDEAQDIIDEIAKSEGIVLADEQKEAVYQALMNGCVVITGGPGTGKTTTINTIIRLMQYLKLNIVLAAPTGRAAKRMSEVTGLEAKTVHRLLGVVRNDDNAIPQFTRDEANPLSADVIIVDEASMLDINLTNSLLRAVKAGAKVIFVGDSDQLPAVGPGNVLGDIIESGAVPVIKLSHIFRQAQESLIVVNAHRINRGEAPVFKAENPDFFFIRRDSQSDAAATIADLYKNRLPFKYNINPINSIQVLSPSKKGSAGTQMLNALLQQEINPPDYMKTELASGKKIYRVGDKVMQIKNNYDLEWITDSGEEGSGIFNGDMGVIEKISLIDKVMDIVFDENKHVEYSFSYIDELDLAYAVTVHKSQGNEFPYVLIPICSFSPFLMFRNLLYTAVTRAREMAIIVGDEKSILKMINNSERSKRYSGLAVRINTVKNLLDKL